MKRIAFYLALMVVAVAAVFAARHFTETSNQNSEYAGQPTIGGPFTLIDHDGKTVTDAAFHGKLTLIFFGYTYCPDICPTSLGTVAAALDILGKDGEAVTPLFISVDPQRDRPEHLREYVHHFHPSMIGLTGSEEQIREAARAYRAFYARVQDEKADEEGYLIDHSAYTYLMGRDGRFLTIFHHGISPEEMASRIRPHL